MTRCSLAPALGAITGIAAALLAPGRAAAYTWMIRHDYTGCNQCHADPSGGGLLTLYGRAQSEVLLRSRIGASEEEPGPVARFAFGLFDLPENLLLGGDAREAWLSVRAVVGASSLITNAQRDVQLLTPLWRHAHGLFARLVPARELVVLVEGDLLLRSQPPAENALGYAGMIQADLEPWQGVHLIGTGDLLDQRPGPEPVSYGGWASLAWFLAPHVDLRFDFVRQSIATDSSRSGVNSLLAQVHLFL